MGEKSGGGVNDLLGALTGGQGGAQGFDALLGRLRQGGLGEQVDSWVGEGANQPVAPEQVEQALGPDLLNNLAQRFGGAGGQGGIAAILAALLPQLINGLTPQGRAPQSDAEVSGGLGGLLSQVLGGAGQGGASQGGLGGLLGGLLGGGAGGSGGLGGLGALLNSLGGGDATATQPDPAPSSKPGLGRDDGGPLPQKPPPLR